MTPDDKRFWEGLISAFLIVAAGFCIAASFFVGR